MVPSSQKRLLDAVEAGPPRAGSHVVDASVDLGIEVAEGLGHRLDRLVVAAGDREELPGPGEIAGPDCLGELLDSRREGRRLALDIRAVAPHSDNELGLCRVGGCR